MQLAQKSKLAEMRYIYANTTQYYWETAYKAFFRLQGVFPAILAGRNKMRLNASKILNFRFIDSLKEGQSHLNGFGLLLSRLY